MSEFINSGERESQYRNAKVIESVKQTDDRIKFLSKDISKLDIKTIAQYLIILTQEVNTFKKANDKDIAILLSKIPELQKNFEELKGGGQLSGRTLALMNKMTGLLTSLSLVINSNEVVDYQPTQYELTELQIDDSVHTMNDILGNDASLITIGVGKYKQSGIPDLKGTLNDVQAVNEKLIEYPSIRKQSLLDENATKESILNTIRNSPVDKGIFLYFAGHGIEGYMMPYSQSSFEGDNKEIDLSKCISPKELFEAIGDKKAIVIVDKCHGGDLALLAPKNITIVSSTDANTSALERSGSGDSNIDRNASLIKEYRPEASIPNGDIRGVATYGLTNTEKGLNIDGFIRSANDGKQNPVIKS